MKTRKIAKTIFCCMAITACLLMAACPGGSIGETIYVDNPNGEPTISKDAINVVVSSESITLAKGQRRTLIATALPTDANGYTLVYDTNNAEVATIGNNGLITAVNVGEAVITATVTNKGGSFYTAECIVTVTPAKVVERVYLNINTLTLPVDGSANLIPNTVPADATDQTFTWGSNAVSVADVNDGGMVTAKSIGTATITLKHKDNPSLTDTCIVTVVSKENYIAIESLTLNKNVIEFTALIGQYEELTAEISPEDATNGEVTWLCTDESVAIKQGDYVYPVGYGNAIIIATTKDGHIAVCTVNVKEPVNIPNAVTGVTLSYNELSMGTGSAPVNLVATVEPFNAAVKGLSWSSSNDVVATVFETSTTSAAVTPVGYGTAIIRVTTDDGGHIATCTVNVQASVIAVTGVSLNKNTTTLGYNDEETLFANVQPANASNTAVRWTSSDTDVAGVDANGKVTAYGDGSTTITVITADGEKTATCVVSVAKQPAPQLIITDTAGVNLENRNASNPIVIGDGATYQLLVKPSSGTGTVPAITWESNDTTKLVVDANGLVTAVGPTTTPVRIMAVPAEGAGPQCYFSVTGIATTGLRLSSESLWIPPNGEAVLTVIMVPWNASNKVITPPTSAELLEAGLTMTQNGLSFTFRASATQGNTTLTFKQGSFEQECNVVVNNTPPENSSHVTALMLNTDRLNIPISRTATLIAAITPNTVGAGELTWVSSNTNAATVDANGTVTGVGEGPTVITATSQSGKAASCNVTVRATTVGTAVTGILLDTAYSQADKITRIMPFSIQPANATNRQLVWYNSDPTVASVTPEGALTSLKPGTTTLRVTTVDGGFSKTCTVTVQKVDVTGVVLNRTTLIELDTVTLRGVDTNTTYTLTATVQPANASFQGVKWESSNPTVATVNSNGVITADKVGVTIITVTSTDPEDSNPKAAQCRVVVRQFRQVLIPAAGRTFQMGSPNTESGRMTSETRHPVTLTQNYYMGIYQVTQADYAAIMGIGHLSYFSGNPTAGEIQQSRPVEIINWYRAVEFCNALSIKEGFEPVYRINGETNPSLWPAIPSSANNYETRTTWDAAQIVSNANGYRLPTEAQWEYACRAGTTTAFSWGSNTWNSHSWGWGLWNSNDMTHEVGLKVPNPWGLYDMHGNVYEHCWDWYDADYYSLQPLGITDPMGPATGSTRVIRGGSFNYDNQMYCRSASRLNAPQPFWSDRFHGMRLVRLAQ